MVEQKVLDELDKYAYSESAVFAVKLALEESLNNAIRHGNRRDPTKTVEVRFEVNGQQATITVTDEGCGFEPRSLPDPTADENLEKPCGRGIMLMRAYMEEIRHNDRGNQVIMVKHNN